MNADSARLRSDTLVIQPLPGIGDMVWHLPHVHALAATSPTGRVDILTKPRSLADRMLAADPSVNDVVWLLRKPGEHDGIRGLWRLARMLKARSYRRVWILHGSARYAFVAWLAGIPERIGFGCGLQTLFVNRRARLPRAQQKDHPISKADALLRLNGIAMPEAEPQMVVDSALVSGIEQHYRDQPRPWYAIGIGSSESAKQWGVERFAELVESLTGGGATCFVVGGPAEQGMAQRIVDVCRASSDRLVMQLGQPIDQVAALLSRCDAYIGNDTGVLNLAAAVGVPSIGIFGGSMPLRHSQRITCVVPDADLDMDTSGAGVYAGGERGMQAIGVARVLEALANRSRGVGA